ncbi:hypothetical protein ACFWC5_01260 [Streptomyces sp. NPDC060085]|uniref:hypothetical protein n=1 Tax=Streptomyces sp. NPDC060085 TaxID=3347054 RepID=UPI003668855C
MEITWNKDAAGSYYAANRSGQVVATARKEGRTWHVEVAHDNRVRQVGTYRQARDVAARVLEDQRWEQVRAEHLTEGDTLRFYDGEGRVTAVEEVGNNLGQLWVTTLFKGERDTITVYPGSTFERLREPESVEESTHALDNPANAPARDTEQETGEHIASDTPALQRIDLRPFVAVVDVIAGTGVLITPPPASEDLPLPGGSAVPRDALLAGAFRRLSALGVEALEGEDGGLSLEGVTDDGRKVFSLYISDCITTEPDFEEVATSIEALRKAAGL